LKEKKEEKRGKGATPFSPVITHATQEGGKRGIRRRKRARHGLSGGYAFGKRNEREDKKRNAESEQQGEKGIFPT